ncbi:primosomal protein N' [Clostridium sp. AF32-12BH]|uniref:replication restart helicase PriA n=1 Tax=Clostridium sp. AF32-12BH TaxID=2292006 RepID=UPI000E50FB8A|nr:primosomal protein N' [Clostridium sp. AF32-12BH]RHP48482.1 primosomal protein N' [Clostridium sp. AF32-12BH]
MAEQYASIIIDISHEDVDRVFQYRIPPALLPQIRVGVQVCVPFGSGNRKRTGYVVELTDKPDYDKDKIKEIIGVTEKSITADSRFIELAWWMKEQYGSTMNQALKTVLPVKKKVKARNKKIVETMTGMPQLPGTSLHDENKTGTSANAADAGNAAGAENTVPAAGNSSAVVLNPEQQAVVDAFCSSYDIGDRTPCLLHGVTGSGKTEVYMAMIDHVLKQQKQVIVLIPEIALTYQTVSRFYSRFGSRICVMHSRLSAGEKCDQFERARKGETDIMIGARSALFTPFPNLGLIILDEEHEGAYKSETTPRYHAREVAEKLAELNEAAFVMGSATPSVEAYAKAQAGIYRLFTLKKRAKAGSELAAVEIADLRKEMEAGNKSIFSLRLQELIKDRLAKKEQVMLFINRRGYSSFVSCRSCGEALKCPHCDVSLTLHNHQRLVCHYCGYQIPMPKKCPHCGSPYLAGFGIGTQKIEEMAAQMFPEAKLLRMDLDTTSKKGGHEKILSAFAKGKADILIGTQMIVKGHDFPGVTLVGVLAADVSLYAPDYTAAERTFQLLVQAAGRAGRGRKAGIALIQTYMPEHYSIQTATSQDYESFFKQEMGYRRLMQYPPACHMLSMQVTGENEELMTRIMEAIAASVRKHFEEQTQIIGPVPAPVYKVNDIYRKILYMKQENYDILIKIQKYVKMRWDETESCKKLTLQCDFT